MNTFNTPYLETAEDFVKENFVIDSIEPIIEYKNDFCSLDWSNNLFYAKIILDLTLNKINIINLIIQKFDDNIIENWLAHSFAKFSKEYGVKELYIPEASDDIKFITPKVGFVENEDGSMTCECDRIYEYHFWKIGDIEEPNWHKEL